MGDRRNRLDGAGLAAAASLVLVALVSCSPASQDLTDDPTPVLSTATTTAESSMTSTTRGTTASDAEEATIGWRSAPKADCRDEIRGYFPDHETDVALGVVRFPGALGYVDADPGVTFKVPVLVAAGSEVLLRVPDEFLDVIELDYAHQSLAGYEVADRVAILPGCGGGEFTAFSGGFEVEGPTCAAIDVYINDSDDAIRIWLPYATTAPCPPENF